MQSDEGRCRGAERLIDIEPAAAGRASPPRAAMPASGRHGHDERRRRPPHRARALPVSSAGAARVAPRRRCATWRTIGGNLLQRTRCGYFRDTGFACNKRAAGSGCPAIDGENRMLAILGAQRALHRAASLRPRRGAGGARRDRAIAGPRRDARRCRSRDFHREPGDTPEIENVLAPGEMITAIVVPEPPAAQRSHYLKVRDRTSFEFALVSAAVAAGHGGMARSRTRGSPLGGVGTRSRGAPGGRGGAARQAGRAIKTFREAAAQAGQGATPAMPERFKSSWPCGARTVPCARCNGAAEETTIMARIGGPARPGGRHG